jgi:hypothetical protein
MCTVSSCTHDMFPFCKHHTWVVNILFTTFSEYFLTNMQLIQHTMSQFTCIFVSIYSQKGSHTQIARCSPSIIRSFMSTALTPSMHTTLQEMGFGGILWLVAKSLDNREFMSCLLDRFDPEDMTIQVRDKHIWVTEHSVKCVYGLPRKGGYPLMITYDAGKKILMDVAAHLFPDQPSPKDIKINPNRGA